MMKISEDEAKKEAVIEHFALKVVCFLVGFHGDEVFETCL